MIFALLDYIRYRRRTGRYGDDVSRNLMALGHLGRVPEETLSLLQPADWILTQKLDSFLSWGVLYFGDCTFDHCAIYLGDGEIIHMTLQGGRKHSINVFGKNTRVLPYNVMSKLLNEKGTSNGESENGGDARSETEELKESEEKPRTSHLLPPKLQLVWLAIGVVLGLHADLFRWRHFLDVVVCAALLDGMSFLLTGHLVFLLVCALWLPVILMSLLVQEVRIWLGRPYQPTNSLHMIMRLMREKGGVLYPDAAKCGTAELQIMSIADVLARRSASRPIG